MNASEKKSEYRVGLIGAGYIADWHAKAVAGLPNVCIAAICDRDEWRAKALADGHGIGTVYTSMEQMYAADHGLDAVQILLPPQVHGDAAATSLEAGVHVLVEKPMCTDVQQADDLIALAARQQRRLCVSHNFLLAEPYRRLAEAVSLGSLGLIDQVRITWSKKLPQLLHGPFGHWMFARPGNLMLEIGPHSMAHLLHLSQLLGHDVSDMQTRVGNPLDLPGGKRAFRRWFVDASCGTTAMQLDFSFVPGVDEHRVYVRGSLGWAVADLENNIFDIDQHTHLEHDFDRYTRLRSRSKQLAKQGRANLANYALSKAKLSNRGNSFGTSIARGIEAFYTSLASGEEDPRISAVSGAEVVRLCCNAGAAANEAAETTHSFTPRPMLVETLPDLQPHVLVAGGSGFIGKALVRKLVEAGHAVRVISRSGADLGLGDAGRMIEIKRGDIRKAEDVHMALEGIDTVYHLARANGKTWKQWYEEDVLATKMLAELSLEHGVKRFVYTSTISALDTGQQRTITDATPTQDPDVVRELYSRTKAASEAMLMELCREKGLGLVITRPGIVLGPGGPPLHSGVAKWSFGRVAQLWGDGRDPLPLVLADDVADALVAMLDAEGIDGQTFNLVGDICLTAREYIEALEKYSKLKFEVRPTPIWRVYGFEMFKWLVKVAVRHHERRMPRYVEWQSRTRRSPFDCSGAKAKLDWKPCTDRKRFVEEAIHHPADEFLLSAGAEPAVCKPEAEVAAPAA